MPKYFDIHSHLDAAQYDADRIEVIQRLRDTDTHTISIGTDLESSKRAVALADKYPEIYACIGVLAVDNTEVDFDAVEFGKLVSHPKVVAIGECGLDFFHADKSDYDRQKKIFIDQIEFAIKHDKPLMIHVRNAYEEILEILESLGGETAKLRGNVHFFAGNWEVAQRFFALGFTVSFTGVITFTHDYDEVIKNAPLEFIMAETDAPYVAPVPYRGKRNEPSYVSEVVKRIAEIRGEDLESVRQALVNNALRMIV
ncbi:MAG: TatD family hydrolase [Candidatus Zambryskibacteria bacterium]|nr:TatD family hydrolase [Candidatus Zambryskibacteria bacterium]